MKEKCHSEALEEWPRELEIKSAAITHHETVKKYYVYILLCSDDSYYTGVTNDLKRRLIEHETGTDPKSYTFRRRPIKLVFQTEFGNVNQAIAFEKQVKGWNRLKKEAIIRGDWHLLPGLSIRKNE